MARVLFVVIPEKGHVNPMIGPAQELQARGHDVAFTAVHDIAPQLKGAGIARFLPQSGENPPPPDANRGRFFAEKVRDAEWLRGWIRMLLVEQAPAQVDLLRPIVRAFRPDVLAIDSMVYPAAIVAALEGVPYAGLSSSLNPVTERSFESALTETVRSLAPSRDQLFARYGQRAEFRVCDVVSPWVNTVFTTRAYLAPDAPPPQTFLVGPSLPRGARGDEGEFPWDKLRRPAVYMSLGSQIYYQPRAFRTVLDAVRGRDVQLVLSVNELLKTGDLGDLPPNALAVHYTPQLRLLERVDAMITHGGANSVMEALSFGVPILIHPICNDQPLQARYVESSGAGRRIDLDRATPAEAWSALESLLAARSPFRAKAAAIRDSYRASDGSLIAARLVERVAATRKPVLRRSDRDDCLTTAGLDAFLAAS